MNLKLNSKILSILHYTDSPNFGGAEKIMSDLILKQNQNGIKSIAVFHNHLNLQPLIKILTQHNLPFILLPKTSKNSFLNFIHFHKIIKKISPTLIHFHCWTPLSNKFPQLYSFFIKIPTIITEHDPFQMNKLKTVIKNLLLKNTKSIITVSKQNENLLKTIYPIHSSKIHTIYNGINPFLFNSKTQLKTITHYKKNNSSLPKIKKLLTIATLHYRKGIDTLIQALSLLPKNYILTIIGIGPEESNLKNLTSKLNLTNRIKFLGFKSNIFPEFQKHHLFILPSRKEAFGLVIIEAATTKIPIIATNTGGISEIANHLELTLIEPENPNLLAKTIISHSLTLTSNPKKLKSPNHPFNLNTQHKQTLELYKKNLI